MFSPALQVMPQHQSRRTLKTLRTGTNLMRCADPFRNRRTILNSALTPSTSNPVPPPMHPFHSLNPFAVIVFPLTSYQASQPLIPTVSSSVVCPRHTTLTYVRSTPTPTMVTWHVRRVTLPFFSHTVPSPGPTARSVSLMPVATRITPMVLVSCVFRPTVSRHLP